MRNNSKFIKNIFNLASELNQLYDVMYSQIEPEVKYIINNHLTDIGRIERCLDCILNIPIDKGSSLFIELCDYYRTINSDNAVSYLEIYEEIYDNESIKIRKKDCKFKQDL